jgi:hypothetical protein
MEAAQARLQEEAALALKFREKMEHWKQVGARVCVNMRLLGMMHRLADWTGWQRNATTAFADRPPTTPPPQKKTGVRPPGRPAHGRQARRRGRARRRARDGGASRVGAAAGGRRGRGRRGGGEQRAGAEAPWGGAVGGAGELILGGRGWGAQGVWMWSVRRPRMPTAEIDTIMRSLPFPSPGRRQQAARRGGRAGAGAPQGADDANRCYHCFLCYCYCHDTHHHSPFSLVPHPIHPILSSPPKRKRIAARSWRRSTTSCPRCGTTPMRRRWRRRRQRPRRPGSRCVLRAVLRVCIAFAVCHLLHVSESAATPISHTTCLTVMLTPRRPRWRASRSSCSAP